MATMVNTVTGPIPVTALGRTLMHEHLFIAFHGAEYDPLAVFEWLDALPERLDCESHESDELIPPADGWSALYWFSCRLRRGATSEGHC